MTATDDAEKALLGALMLGWDDIDDLHVTAADFYQPVHAEVFAAILRVAATGQRPDVQSVRLAIGPTIAHQDTGLLLLDLVAGSVAPQAPYYAGIVTQAADRRGLALAGVKVQQMADSDSAVDELIEEARGLLDRAPRRQTAPVESFGDQMAALVDRVEQGVKHGVSTPWPDLDDAITGLHPGMLYLVAGRPGTGKSLVGQGIATHVAKRHGKAALVASLEMQSTEYYMRVVANLGKLELNEMLRGSKSEILHRRIGKVYADHAGMPLFVDDTFSQTITHIRSRARSIARKQALGVVVVDYLQLLTATDRKMPREQQVSEMSRSLKSLARELQVPVIALCQLNRESERRQDKRPLVSDLRESGSLEQDADAVILLHRDDEARWEVRMIVGKNRWGEIREFTLGFVGHHAELRNLNQPPRGLTA